MYDIATGHVLTIEISSALNIPEKPSETKSAAEMSIMFEKPRRGTFRYAIIQMTSVDANDKATVKISEDQKYEFKFPTFPSMKSLPKKRWTPVGNPKTAIPDTSKLKVFTEPAIPTMSLPPRNETRSQ
jgi:hypothetical protein